MGNESGTKVSEPGPRESSAAHPSGKQSGLGFGLLLAAHIVKVSTLEGPVRILI